MSSKCNQDQITVQFNGQISITREKLKMLLMDEFHEIPDNFQKLPSKINWPENSKNGRLAYTMQETAEILGISYISVHRLIKRGLLKKANAVRKIIIPATEIARLLKESL